MADVLAVYADGGVIHVNPSPLAGTWAWRHVGHGSLPVAEASGILLPADLGTPAVSNNQTEFAAALFGLEALPDGWSGQLCTDSNVTIQRLRWIGWNLGVDLSALPQIAGIPEAWHIRTRRLFRDWLGTVEYVLHSGHPTRDQLRIGRGKGGRPVSHHNVACDRACGQEAERFLARQPQAA